MLRGKCSPRALKVAYEMMFLLVASQTAMLSAPPGAVPGPLPGAEFGVAEGQGGQTGDDHVHAVVRQVEHLRVHDLERHPGKLRCGCLATG